MAVRKYVSEINKADFNKEVTVAGWIQDIRKLGSIAFIQLRDRTGVIQVTVLKEYALFRALVGLPRESVLSVKGVIKENKEAKAGFELIPESFELIGIAKTPLPLGVIDKVGVEFDTRFEHRFIDLRKPEVQAVFKIKHTFLKAARAQLEEEGFIEVHTPKLIVTATEGGTNLFPVQYFERNAYLAQSPQLYKQMMMATGLDKVYEIAPCFRAEEHNTVRHLNEFIALDIEMAFADEEDVMQVLERIIARGIKNITEENKKELGLLGVKFTVPQLPFKRVEYGKCIEIANSKNIKLKSGEDFSPEALKAIGEDMNGFYFITKWPTATKPFYIQPFKDNMELCRAFDLMYWEKEITSGGQRVHDVALLTERLRRQGLKPESFKHYLEAFEYGMPHHAGWGLGIERIIMTITGMQNIRECVLFPRDRTRLEP